MRAIARGSRFQRRHLALVAAAGISAAAGGVFVAPVASAATGCSVDYKANSWNSGFTAEVRVVNLGDPITNWNLKFSFPGDQKVTSSWGGTATQSGHEVTITNMAWNGTLSTNGATTPGFQGTYSGTNDAPSGFTLNGVACNGGTTTPTPTPTQTDPSSSPSSSADPTPEPGTHVDNPFVGAKAYVNPDWSKKAAAEPGGSKVSNQPTAVWLDTIAAITAPEDSGYTTGLRQHLDNALEQGANLATFVVYNLPGRDCSALASNGELGPEEIDRYKSEYIDPIAEIQADPKYDSIRIVNIVEIDSLPNLVTNAGSEAGATENCKVMKANGNYEKGIAYALGTLHSAGSNIYNYIDAAHHGWIGWDSNFGPSAELFAKVAKTATGGVATVDGFITNTANYSALTEPFVKIDSTVNGQQVRQSKWVDWNQYTDELTFAQGFRQKLVSSGFDSKIGMLIDTSRNGWGGSKRPTKASSSTDVNTWVNESRIDRRIHAGNWCNQSGAGLGERPKAAPATGIDAYVWVKPPGESDGSSKLIPTGPDNPGGKGFDGMCDPEYGGNGRNGNSASGALPDSPVSGAWFSAQFRELLANAYPAL
jgi:cellulose 1,4-beta-cellobiosidase